MNRREDQGEHVWSFREEVDGRQRPPALRRPGPWPEATGVLGGVLGGCGGARAPVRGGETEATGESNTEGRRGTDKGRTQVSELVNSSDSGKPLPTEAAAQLREETQEGRRRSTREGAGRRARPAHSLLDAGPRLHPAVAEEMREEVSGGALSI